MQTIANFLAGFGKILVGIYSYLRNIVDSAVYILQLLTYFAVNIPKYFAWLPGEFLGILGVAFGIAVVYKILGKEG